MLKIRLVRLTKKTDIKNLQNEVFQQVIDAAIKSGLHECLEAATLFATEKVVDIFKQYPFQQTCFNIEAVELGVVGRIWLMERSFPDNTLELRLAYLKVDETYQKKGIATNAISLLEKYASKNNYTRISLNVFAHLPHAKNLYETLGFRTIEEHKKAKRLISTEMAKRIAPDSPKEKVDSSVIL